MKKKTLSEKLIKDIRKNTGLAIAAAFALIIALTWNEAIKEGVNKLVETLGIPNASYIFSIITAIIITFICVMGILIFSRWSQK